MSSNKLVDYNSSEKAILYDIFNSIPFMDNWIAIVIENYIYSSEREYYIIEGEQKRKLKCQYRTRFGIKDGEYKEWFSHGQLKKQTTFVDGKIKGENKEWFYLNVVNNLLLVEHTWVDDVLHGKYKEWFDNGQLKVQTTYVKGKLHGEYKSWRYTGEHQVETTYEKGKLHGEYKVWSYNGKLIVQSTYEHGLIMFNKK